MRDVTLVLENNSHLEFNDCLYVLKFRKNLISVFNLNKSNYLVYFNENIFIRNNNSFIFLGPLVNNLFHITFVFLLSIVENHPISLKRKIPSTNQTYDIHV